MDKDFSELIEYLDKKFQETAKKNDLLKLLTTREFDQFKKEVNQRFDELRKDLRSLIASIDKLVKAIETYRQEQAALSAKVDRHETWINQIAEKLGIELKVEDKA